MKITIYSIQIFLRITSGLFLMTFVSFGCTSKPQSFSRTALSQLPDTISYSSDYGGHLQGMTTDYDKYLFWSHTTQVVKTDLEGNVLKTIDVPTHYGDLAYFNRKIYVAVNFGKFNEEPGLSDSWIYVYKASDLSFIEKHPVPEVVHGAGGIAIHNDRAMVVGGLPALPKYTGNFVYEYDMNFNLRRIHILESGYTRLGIQTADWSDGYWYFGCYSSADNPNGKVLKAEMDENDLLKLVAMYDRDMSYGLIGLGEGRFLYSKSSLNRKAAKLSLIPD